MKKEKREEEKKKGWSQIGLSGREENKHHTNTMKDGNLFNHQTREHENSQIPFLGIHNKR